MRLIGFNFTHNVISSTGKDSKNMSIEKKANSDYSGLNLKIRPN